VLVDSQARLGSRVREEFRACEVLMVQLESRETLALRVQRVIVALWARWASSELKVLADQLEYLEHVVYLVLTALQDLQAFRALQAQQDQWDRQVDLAALVFKAPEVRRVRMDGLVRAVIQETPVSRDRQGHRATEDQQG